MATQDRAAFSRDTLEGVRWNANVAATIESGVFARYSAGEYFKATTTAHGATLIGVTQARTPLPKGEPGGPEEPDIEQGLLKHIGIFTMNGRAAETYAPFDYVVIDGTPADGQSVRLYNAGGGDTFDQIVGVVWPGMAAAGVLGGAFNIPVWLAPTGLGRNNKVDTLTLV